jgi:YidC/Oxa1 family membrane protein insertase
MGYPSYAIAIVLFTLIIRVLLAPLGWKQTVSMRNMAEVQPIMEKLKKKYSHNKELYQQKLMELYKRRKINPMSGCLPLLVQLPIIICFYRMLLTHQYGTGRDAYFFDYPIDTIIGFDFSSVSTILFTFSLPILVGLSAFAMQKVTMAISGQKKKPITDAKGRVKEQPQGPPNPMQSPFFLVFMAGFMAFIMTWVPAGMALYFITYNVTQVIQTVAIMKILDAQKKKKALEAAGTTEN